MRAKLCVIITLVAVILAGCDTDTPPTPPPPTVAVAPALVTIALPTLLPLDTGPIETVVSFVPATPTEQIPPTPEPTSTPRPPNPRGIGMAREAWEAVHGAPTGNGKAGLMYEGQKYEVLYNSNNLIITITGSGTSTLDEARAVSKTLIPGDAEEASSTHDATADGKIVYDTDVYHSQWLKGVFSIGPGTPEPSADPWRGAEPGTFQVVFTTYPAKGNLTEQFTIILGLGSE